MYKYIFLRNIVVLYPFVALKNQISQSKEEQVTHSRNKSNTQRETSFIYIYIGLDMTCNVIVWFNYGLVFAFLFLFSRAQMYQMYLEKAEQAGRNIKYMYFLLYCNLCIQFLVGKKTSKSILLRLWFSGCQEKQLKSNQMITKLIEASQRG